MKSRLVAALAAIVWILAILPPQLLEWSGRSGTPAWVLFLYDSLGYASLERALGSVDPYVLFGAGVVPAMLLVWWSLRPALRGLGWSGTALSWGWFALAPVTALSYLSAPEDSPLHVVWGAEGFWLLLLFAWAVLVAIVAPRGQGIPLWLRISVGLTVLFGVLGTLLATYYPHGTMLGIAAQAVVLARWPGVSRADAAAASSP